MKKTILAAVLVFVLVFSSLPIMAADPVDADVTVNINTLEAMVKNFGDNLTSMSAAERKDIFDVAKTYLATERGIDTIKQVLNGELEVEGIQKLLDAIGGTTNYKNELLMGLDFIDAFPESARTTYLEDLENREEYEFDSDAQDSLEDVYNRFTTAGSRETLEQHGFTANVLVNPIDALEGRISLTDASYTNGDLKLESINSTFESALDEKWSYISSVNGRSVSGAEEIIEAIIEAVNDASTSSELNDIKDVLEPMGIYTPLSSPTPTPTSTATRRPGTGGGSIYIPSNTVTPPPVTTSPVPTPAPATGDGVFGDTENHWAKDYVAASVEMGLFRGDENGNFNPDNGFTRQEAAVVMMRALGLEGTSVTQNITFLDVATISDWALNSVKLSIEKNVFQGYPDTSFKPHETITREQFVAVVERALRGTDQGTGVPTFSDADSIGDWAKAAVYNAVDAGVIDGYEDNTFRPAAQVTRAEAAKILYAAMHAYNRV